MEPTTTDNSQQKQQKEIDAYITRVNRETGLTPEQIKTDLLFDAVSRAKAEYHDYDEIDGVLGGCGHSTEELIFNSKVCAVGCGFFTLIMIMFLIVGILQHFGIIK